MADRVPGSLRDLLNHMDDLHDESRRVAEGAQAAIDRARQLLGSRSVVEITASGNGEERQAQIEHIQDRLERLRRLADHLTTEVAAMIGEVAGLAKASPATPSTDGESN